MSTFYYDIKHIPPHRRPLAPGTCPVKRVPEMAKVEANPAKATDFLRNVRRDCFMEFSLFLLGEGEILKQQQ